MLSLLRSVLLVLATIWIVGFQVGPVWAVDSLAEAENKPAGTYSIVPVTRFSSDFKVTVSGLSDANYYAVYRNGMKIGGVIPLTQGLRSMPQVFSETGMLEVYFFKTAEGNRWVRVATLNGCNQLEFREGCFIATAAYGSKFQPAVVLLRHFRDQYLMNNSPGRWFVNTYYQYSPPVADCIADSSALRMFTRVALTPLVAMVYLLFHPGTVWVMLILAGIMIGWRQGLGKKMKLPLTLLIIPLLILCSVIVTRAAEIAQVEDGYLRIGNDVYSLQSNSFTDDRIAKSLAVLNQCYYKNGGLWYDVFAAEQDSDLNDTTKALDNSVVSSWSNLRTWYKPGIDKDTFQIIPEAVSGLAAAPISYSQIDLNWSAIANADYYEIFRDPDDLIPVVDGIFTKVGTANTTNYSNTGLVESTVYYYRVRAVNDAGAGEDSAVIAATTQVGAKFYVNEAIKCYNSGDYAGAVSQASLAIGIDGQCADAYAIRAGSYLQLDQDDFALDDATNALRINPGHAQALIARGWCYLKHGIWTAAFNDLNSALGIDASLARAYKGRGICRAQLGQVDEALNDFNSYIRLQSSDPQAYFLRGNTYLEQDNYQNAITDHSRAVQLDAQYAEAYNNRGAAYHMVDQEQTALGDFDQAILLDSQNECYYNNSGLACYSLDQYQNALNRFNQAITLYPNYVGAYNNRAMVYLELGQGQQSLNDWARAIQLDASFAAPFLNRGWYYYDLEQYPAAANDFSQAILLGSQEEPSDSFNPGRVLHFYIGGGLADAYYGRGCVYFEQGQYQNAIADYSQVVRLNPDRYHVYSWRAWAYLQLDQYDNAIADFTNHLTKGGDSVSSYNGRGWCYFFKGRYYDAIADFTNAIRVNPQNANAYDGRGWSYYRLGQYVLAEQSFRQCLALDPDNEDAKDGLRALGYYVAAGMAEVQEPEKEPAFVDMAGYPSDRYGGQIEKAEPIRQLIPVP